MSELKCANCGSSRIQVKAWVDANNGIFISDMESDNPDDTWCSDCETHAGFVEDLNDKENSDSKDAFSQAFADKADDKSEREEI